MATALLTLLAIPLAVMAPAGTAASRSAKALAVPAAPAAPAPARAPAPASDAPTDIGYFTGEQLSERCGRTDPTSSSYCFAYIAAVTDTARAYEIWLGAREFCLPSKIAQSEVRRAFLTYVGAYPRDAQGQAASVVINALKTTYPCD